MSAFNIIADDKNLITYRPKLRAIGKSVTGVILLQQIMYRYKQNDYKPFYKFKAPCDHPAYTVGDSWCEELGFSQKEFDGALKGFAIKIKKGDNKAVFAETYPVFFLDNYWPKDLLRGQYKSA